MDKTHQILERIALNIKFTVRPVFHHGGDFKHIGATDVTLVWARVNGNAIGTRLQAQPGRAHYIGYAEMPSVAQQGDLVDVDRQSSFMNHDLQRLKFHHHLAGF